MQVYACQLKSIRRFNVNEALLGEGGIRVPRLNFKLSYVAIS